MTQALYSSNLFLAARDLQDFEQLFTQIHEPIDGKSKQPHSPEHLLRSIIEEVAKRKFERPHLGETLDRIALRAQRNLDRLASGLPVKIPVYYHATKTMDVAKKILQGSILAMDAKEGKGTYISSEIEPIYGDFIFAIAREDVETRDLSLDSNVNKSKVWPESNSGRAVWRALKDNLPMLSGRTSNAAYLILKNSDYREEAEQFITTLNLDTPLEILSYEEALVEHKIISDLQGVYETKQWSQHWQASAAAIDKFIMSAKQRSAATVELDSDDWN